MLHLTNKRRDPGVAVLARGATIVWAGVQDAMVQWWYGHNGVGFFSEPGFLGVAYYFIPKRAEQPIYSYQPLHHPFLGPDLPLYLGTPTIICTTAPSRGHGALA